MVVAQLGPGDYTLEIRGQFNTSGSYRLKTFLPGDADGDHRVTPDDAALIRANYGAKVGDAGYSSAADANLDGQLTSFDLAQLHRNLNASEQALSSLTL